MPLSSKAETKFITMVGTEGTKKSAQGKWLSLIYTEAFNRLGYSLKYIGYPAKRASLLSDRGKVDGEIHRVASYGDKHPNVIRVNEPHFSIYFSAFGIKPDLKVNGWNSLKGSGYKVNHRRGVKLTSSKLPSVVEKADLEIISKPIQGLRKVVIGRTDLYIDVETVIKDLLVNSGEFENSKIRKIGVMEKINVHMFMHKKNIALVPKLEEILKKMKKEGLIKKYKQDVGIL